MSNDSTNHTAGTLEAWHFLREDRRLGYADNRFVEAVVNVDEPSTVPHAQWLAEHDERVRLEERLKASESRTTTLMDRFNRLWSLCDDSTQEEYVRAKRITT